MEQKIAQPASQQTPQISEISILGNFDLMGSLIEEVEFGNHQGSLGSSEFEILPIIRKMQTWNTPVVKAFYGAVSCMKYAEADTDINDLIKVFDTLNAEMPKDLEKEIMIKHFHEMLYNPLQDYLDESQEEYEEELEVRRAARSAKKKEKASSPSANKAAKKSSAKAKK